MKLPRPLLTISAVLGIAVLLFLPADVTAAPLAGLDDTCLETQLKGCTVMASGYIALEHGPRIAFQTQAGFTDEDGVKGGVVLFEEEPDGWTPFASAFDGYRYEVPRLVEHELTLLHVAGVVGGSGSHNADLLFAWGDEGAALYTEGWRPVDIDSWYATVADLLPVDHEIWQGVDYDFDDWFYNRLNASTPLWRGDDGNCCPSGGWATIHFALENDTLIATGVDHQPPAKAK